MCHLSWPRSPPAVTLLYTTSKYQVETIFFKCFGETLSHLGGVHLNDSVNPSFFFGFYILPHDDDGDTHRK